MHPATIAIHADSEAVADVSPPMHISTTYKYPSGHNEAAAVKNGWMAAEPGFSAPNNFHIYSRDTLETRTRVEKVLGELDGGQSVVYSSGLAAISALFETLQPQTILISNEGYHGTHGTLERYTKGRSIQVLYLEENSDPSHLAQLKPGDLVLLESPQNPRGEVADIAYYAQHIQEGVYLAVDATFCPPPLQRVLDHGAHIVMHSCTKFLGGHSDLLAGVLTSKDVSLVSKVTWK
jgi:cystathionine gamma-synthase